MMKDKSRFSPRRTVMTPITVWRKLRIRYVTEEHSKLINYTRITLAQRNRGREASGATAAAMIVTALVATDKQADKQAIVLH